jgi:hypothetical protein
MEKPFTTNKVLWKTKKPKFNIYEHSSNHG